MNRVLTAERAVLLKLESLGIVLLILICLIISLLALFACECELVTCTCLSHCSTPP